MSVQMVTKPSLFRKLRAARTAIKKGSEATVEELAELGKIHAKNYAPYLTGYTRDSIITKRSMQTSKGPSARIMIDPGMRLRPNDGIHRSANANDKFNLVGWMHKSANRGHFKTGNPQFMFAARRYLNKIKKRVAKGKFNIKIK